MSKPDTPSLDQSSEFEKRHAFGAYFWPPAWCGEPPESKFTFAPEVLAEVACDVTDSDSGIRFAATRGGRLMLQFPENAELYRTSKPPHEIGQPKLRMAQTLNALLVFVYSACNRHPDHKKPPALKTYVTPPDVVYADDPVSEFVGMTGFSKCSPQMGVAFPSTYHESAPTGLDSRNLHRFAVIPVGALHDGFGDFIRSSQHSKQNALELMAILLSSIRHFEEHDFNMSLLTAWSIIEHMLAEKWKSYIEKNKTRNIDGVEVGFLVGERKKNLLKSLDYTASTKIEILSLVEEIKPTAYDRLTDVRKARNHWIHRLESVKPMTAMESIILANQFIKSEMGIDVAVFPS